jgi:hypothetical protein
LPVNEDQVALRFNIEEIVPQESGDRSRKKFAGANLSMIFLSGIPSASILQLEPTAS